MSAIRLEDVTKIFSRNTLLDRMGDTRSFSRLSRQSDRAFADRVAAQTARDERSRSSDEKIVALDHLNLTVPDGQTFAVVGPSGCGKTTLLRVICGLESHLTGRVFYDDQDMADVKPMDRFIGMVFQNYALYPHFKSKGNLGFFFRMHNRPDAEAEGRIRITAQMMGIGFEELLKRKPGTLSGGQQQRVAIARALVRNPRLFLFDEPLSNLDAKLRTQTRVEIKRLLHRFRITAVYVTHDQVEAITLGDQIAVMREGRVEQVAAYRELMDNPANSFVAGFLGTPPMNLFTDGVASDGALYLGEMTIPLPEALRALTHSGQRLTFGVRPEAAKLVLGDQSLPEGIRLEGTAETVEPDFSRRTQLAYVRTGDVFYSAMGTMDTLVNVGDNVQVLFPADQLYFFDGESEQRIG